jgi:hypothetical protein
MENQAELLSGSFRRQNDSASGAKKMAERVKARVTKVAGSHASYVSKPREVI